MFKIFATLSMAVCLSVSIVSAGNHSIPRTEINRCLDPSPISPSIVRYVLRVSSETWQINYGRLRSAYELGDLTIEEHIPTPYPPYPAYDVTFEGNLLCVIVVD